MKLNISLIRILQSDDKTPTAGYAIRLVGLKVTFILKRTQLFQTKVIIPIFLFLFQTKCAPLQSNSENYLTMKHSISVLFLLCSLYIQAQDNYKTIKDISYAPTTETDTYRLERCKLDIYYPTFKKDFATIVWFHGGGLENGEKFFPEELKAQGFAIVAVNYRLSPKATNPAYTDDAAAAVAWTFANIEQYGGSKSRIYVSGHSAGGYLTLMLCLDKRYLGKYGVNADNVAAYLPVSGQTTTHYTIRSERGLSKDLPVIDEYAPSNQSRKETAPILLITGDRTLEMTARYEENAHLQAVLKGLGNTNVKLYEMQGFDHGTVLDPACILIRNYIKNQK